MPGSHGLSLGSNFRVPKMFGGNAINNSSSPAARGNCKGTVMTGKCECDIYGTQRQRRASELKEVERIRQFLDKLQHEADASAKASSATCSSSSSLGKKKASEKNGINAQKNGIHVQELPTLDECSEGLEARMRAEFVMIKDRLRKMEKDLHLLGTTR